MRMIQNQTVRQLTFYPALFPVNCYLVEEENEVTLIDTGLPNSYKGIIQAVNQLGKPLQHILLTHAHGDHVGSLDVLSQAFPDAKVVISERDSFLLKGDVSLRKDEPQTPIKGGIPKKSKQSLTFCWRVAKQSVLSLRFQLRVIPREACRFWTQETEL